MKGQREPGLASGQAGEARIGGYKAGRKKLVSKYKKVLTYKNVFAIMSVTNTKRYLNGRPAGQQASRETGPAARIIK